MINDVKHGVLYNGVALSLISIEQLREAETETINRLLEHSDRLIHIYDELKVTKEFATRSLDVHVTITARDKEKQLLIAIQNQINYRYATTLV